MFRRALPVPPPPTDARRTAVSGFRATFTAFACADYGLHSGVGAWFFVALRGAVFDWPDPCASAFLRWFCSLLSV